MEIMRTRPEYCYALPMPRTLEDLLPGTWTLVSWRQRRADGSVLERYGSNPKGIAFFDADGRYIITVMQSGRANYASNALWQGTPEENKVTADGTITYFGTYTVNPADSSIDLVIEGSSFPNWNGTRQKRIVAVTEAQLVLTVQATNGETVDVVWNRATS
jgi:hypothetical protein